MSIDEIDVVQLEMHLDGGGVLLDVRNPDEFDEAHVPGAVLIPLAELEQRLAEVPDGEPLAVICRSGARSMVACEMLASLPRTAVNVTGGTLAWMASGRDTVAGSTA